EPPNAAIAEDNAHGLMVKYGGRSLGALGAMATLSFHETKNVTCGEGGALLINDARLIERAEIVREKGTNRSRFFRGQVDKYTWVDIGSSYLMSDVLAAFLYGQLEQWQLVQAKRRQGWEHYHNNLAEWARDVGARQPDNPECCEQAYRMYSLSAAAMQARSA